MLLAAVTSLKISGKVTLRGKRRLTGIQFIWAVRFAGIFAITESVLWEREILSVTTWKCVGISRGMILYNLFDQPLMIFGDFSDLKNLPIHMRFPF
ncbi:hypothetical protein A2I97_06385 [Bacillus velezensis]|nr:hypothetical protein A2I97_06385 [Bacillus velezensis]